MKEKEEKKYRDLDSVGAVGAAAPTDFEENSFCNLNLQTKIPLAIVFGEYLKICTHSFKIQSSSLVDICKFFMLLRPDKFSILLLEIDIMIRFSLK